MGKHHYEQNKVYMSIEGSFDNMELNNVDDAIYNRALEILENGDLDPKDNYQGLLLEIPGANDGVIVDGEEKVNFVKYFFQDDKTFIVCILTDRLKDIAAERLEWGI